MSPSTWNVGDRVRFVGTYEVPGPAEVVTLPRLEVGTRGVIVEVRADRVLVEVAGVERPIPVWFPEAFPDDFAKTTLLQLDR